MKLSTLVLFFFFSKTLLSAQGEARDKDNPIREIMTAITDFTVPLTPEDESRKHPVVETLKVLKSRRDKLEAWYRTLARGQGSMEDFYKAIATFFEGVLGPSPHIPVEFHDEPSQYLTIYYQEIAQAIVADPVLKRRNKVRNWPKRYMVITKESLGFYDQQKNKAGDLVIKKLQRYPCYGMIIRRDKTYRKERAFALYHKTLKKPVYFQVENDVKFWEKTFRDHPVIRFDEEKDDMSTKLKEHGARLAEAGRTYFQKKVAYDKREVEILQNLLEILSQQEAWVKEMFRVLSEEKEKLSQRIFKKNKDLALFRDSWAQASDSIAD